MVDFPNIPYATCDQYCEAQEGGTLGCVHASSPTNDGECTTWFNSTCGSNLFWLGKPAMCECAPKPVTPRVLKSPCDQSKMTDIIGACDIDNSCKVMVNNMGFIHGNCNNYCEHQGLSCAGAHLTVSDANASCTPGSTANVTCNSLFYDYDSRICECLEPQTPTVSPSSNFSVSPTFGPSTCDITLWSDIVTPCANCQVSTNSLWKYWTCEAYCAAQGELCLAADLETDEISCQIVENVTCATNIFSQYGSPYGLCTCGEEKQYSTYGCDENSWIHSYKACDTCTSLVDLTTHLTCENYCSSQQGGLECRGFARVDQRDYCFPIPAHNVSCSTNVPTTFGTNDGICGCRTPQPAIPAIECSFREWRDVFQACADCSASISSSFFYRSCDDYCAKQQSGLDCASAFIEHGIDPCTPIANISCSSEFFDHPNSYFVCECKVRPFPTSSPTVWLPPKALRSTSSSESNQIVTGVSVACAVLAFAGFWYMVWIRRKTKKKGAWRGETDDDILFILQDDGEELPEDINIFKGIEDVDAQKWNKIFVDFLVKTKTTVNTRKALSSHGRLWKGHLFRFLTGPLATAEDFQVIEEQSGNPVSVKMKIVRTAVTILSSIDIEDFSHVDEKTEKAVGKTTSRFNFQMVPLHTKTQTGYVSRGTQGRMATSKWMKKPLRRTRESFALIKESAKFGSKKEENAVKALLLYCLGNQLKGLIFGPNGANHRASSLASRQWRAIEKYFHVILQVVLVDHESHPFFLDENQGMYACKKLLMIVYSLTSKRAIGKILTKDSIESMKVENPRRTHREIDRRAIRLRRFVELYHNLHNFMKMSGKLSADEKKKNMKDMRRRSVKKPDGEMRISIDEKSLVSVHNKNDSLPQTLRKMINDEDSPGGKSMLKIAEILVEEKVSKNKSDIIEALIFSAEKMEKAAVLSAMNDLASRTALGGQGASSLIGTAHGVNTVRMLLKPQVKELDQQIVMRNCVSKKMGIYKARLSGVPVSLKLLKTNVLNARLKAGLLMHQKLATSPFVVQMFGSGYSATCGWFVALEYIDKSLADVINSWPPLAINKRAFVAIDVARAFEFLHDQTVYHRDIAPIRVLVTSTFQIKIADFSLSEELSGGDHTLKTLQSTASVNSAQHPVYRSPELHVSGIDHEKATAMQAAKMDVFSLGAILCELMRDSRKTLTNILPGMLSKHYRELAEENGVDFKVDAKSEKNTTAAAIDVAKFKVPKSFLEPIQSATRLDPNARPTMKDLRAKLEKATKILEDEKRKDDDILYLKRYQVDEIERSLTIKNLIEGTKNVYKIKLFGGVVAVKILGSDTLTGVLRQEVRILQEASKHPFVVKLHGCGCSTRFGWFLCMEYIPSNLEDICFRADSVAVATRLKIAINLAQGFSYLHKNGVFHRDIKPLNVLVTSDFKIRICDFGISQEMKDSEDKRALTVDHAGILGTPLYMAPEQHIAGDNLKRLTPEESCKIDVYAYGVMMLEMFSGNRASSVLPVKSLPQFYSARKDDLQSNPAERAFESKSMDVDIGMEMKAVIDRCCAFSPEARPTMEEIVTMLDAAAKTMGFEQDMMEVEDDRRSVSSDSKSPMVASHNESFQSINQSRNNNLDYLSTGLEIPLRTSSRRFSGFNSSVNRIEEISEDGKNTVMSI